MNDLPTPKPAFTPTLLGELGLTGSRLFANLHYADTPLKKTGKDQLLKKLLGNKGLGSYSDPTISMDMDLSCVIFDTSLSVLDVVWFGNLRDSHHSVRHTGDALAGYTDFLNSLHPQEQIQIHLNRLDDDVKHLVFVLSCQAPLHLAQKALAHLTDDENHSLHRISFDSLDKEATGIIAWYLQKSVDGMKLHAPLKSIKVHHSDPSKFRQQLCDTTLSYLMDLHT